MHSIIQREKKKLFISTVHCQRGVLYFRCPIGFGETLNTRKSWASIQEQNWFVPRNLGSEISFSYLHAARFTGTGSRACLP
uniref:Uncharacterized protein n=1 Tax=Arundo donax TaxID=35708 RepID=A0A0A9EBG4_ARUDO